MNFLNPLLEIYLSYPQVDKYEVMPFYREVLWLFSKHLDNRLKMFKHRVNIEIEEAFSEPGNLHFGSIYTYQTRIDIEEFVNFSEQSKRKVILELVYAGLTSLANEHNWDQRCIDDAYEKSVEDNYRFVYRSDFKLSRNKKQKGRIRINLTEHLATFTSEIGRINDENLMAQVLLETDQVNFSWGKDIREFGWMDSNNFGLKLAKGQIWLTSNPELEEVSIRYVPKHSKLEHLESYLNNLKKPLTAYNYK
ncbi:MAG: hypothetical protein HEP71_13460 [Roseivirga sp.]|nr:hypothetical protein [Roseivirga sp.]